jgi:predicted amidohydrolase
VISTVKTAICQIRVGDGDLEGNCDRAARAVSEAARKGADLALLPEAADFGWIHDAARSIGEGDSPLAATYAELSGEYEIYVCGGFVERSGEELFNSAALFGPDGVKRLHHRKINELTIARHLFACGDSLGVAETEEFGRLGLMICADAFYGEQAFARALAAMGARLILSPSAWAVPPDHDNAKTPYGDQWRGAYRPVARDLGLPIAACSGVGQMTQSEWKGHPVIGNSLVVGCDGEDIAVGQYGQEEVRLVEVPLRDTMPWS